MAEISKTPDEIKIGLECCKRYMGGAPDDNCDVCPYQYRCSELYEDNLAYIRQLEAERDAAVKDLGVVRDCKVCKNYDCRACDEPCKHCGIAQTCWEWRGLPEQKKEEEE